MFAGELGALRHENVDLEAGMIRVERSCDRRDGFIDPKSRAGRRAVPIVAALRLSRPKLDPDHARSLRPPDARQRGRGRRARRRLPLARVPAEELTGRTSLAAGPGAASIRGALCDSLATIRDSSDPDSSGFRRMNMPSKGVAEFRLTMPIWRLFEPAR